MTRALLAAVALLFAAAPAVADGPAGKPVAAPGGFVPSVALCTIGADGKAICAAALPVSAKADQRTFALASNASLAAGSCGAPVLADVSAQYGWIYQFAGSTTIMLKFRGPDGATYLTSGYTATATGSQFVPITAGAGGAYVEVCNTGSASATSLYATLAN